MVKKINENGKNATEIFEQTVQADIDEMNLKKLEEAICHTFKDMYGFYGCSICPIGGCVFSANNSNMYENRMSYLRLLAQRYNKISGKEFYPV
jgi:hypothetical protein